VLVLFGAFCFIAAVWRELLPEITPPHDIRRLPPAVLLSINGFLVLVSLAALVGLLAS
jgi:putative membrane protein